MVSNFTHEDGRTWTPKQRRKSLALTKLAIKNGEIPSPEQLGCTRCGQKLGIIEYHNHDYDSPTEFLEALCFKCHRRLHSPYPKSTRKYFDEVAEGKQYPPVYRKKERNSLPESLQ